MRARFDRRNLVRDKFFGILRVALARENAGLTRVERVKRGREETKSNAVECVREDLTVARARPSPGLAGRLAILRLFHTAAEEG